MTTFKDLVESVSMRGDGSAVYVDLDTIIAFGKQRGEDVSALETMKDEIARIRAKQAKKDRAWDDWRDSLVPSPQQNEDISKRLIAGAARSVRRTQDEG